MNTMGQILRNWRILAAAAFSLSLVIGAYEFARSVATPSLAQASTETALLKAVASRDSDSDGLADWEESLYGTDAHLIDSFKLGMTDGEAVSRGLIVPKAIADVPMNAPDVPEALPGSPTGAADGTLTDAFAKNFFTLYLSAKQGNNGAELSEGELSSIAEKALSSLAQSISVAPDFKTTAEVKISSSGSEAFLAYAVAAEGVMQVQGVQLPKSELQYLEDAINGDSGALEHIRKIAAAYRSIAAGLAVLPVPSELAPAHLSMVNAMARISAVSGDFARVDSDPISTMLALSQYPKAVTALAGAFRDIGAAYEKVGTTLSPGTPGASFVNVIKSIQESKPSKP